jgi:hypothetical protein
VTVKRTSDATQDPTPEVAKEEQYFWLLLEPQVTLRFLFYFSVGSDWLTTLVSDRLTVILQSDRLTTTYVYGASSAPFLFVVQFILFFLYV